MEEALLIPLKELNVFLLRKPRMAHFTSTRFQTRSSNLPVPLLPPPSSSTSTPALPGALREFTNNGFPLSVSRTLLGPRSTRPSRKRRESQRGRDGRAETASVGAYRGGWSGTVLARKREVYRWSPAVLRTAGRLPPSGVFPVRPTSWFSL